MSRVSASRAASAAVAVIAAAALCADANPPAQNVATLRAQLNDALARAVAHYARIAAQSGFADQLVARLYADQTDVMLVNPSDETALERLRARVMLDADLVAQLAGSSTSTPFQGVGSAGIDLVRSSADKTLQPLAIYLPAGYGREKAAPLLVMLHGQQQTETGLLSEPALRSLADASGVIVAAPWLRGDTPVNSLTTGDLNDAVAFAQANYRVDRRRTYLGGVSMGAYNAFLFAASNPQDWAAVLCIAGSLRNDDKELFARAMRSKAAYLVAGSEDPVVRPEYVQSTVSYLNANGVIARLYEQPGGSHSLESLQPVLAQAWNDMLAGVHEPMEALPSPTPVPLPSIRT
jgi:poly(3-hydroxybutyrate) depolymerase